MALSDDVQYISLHKPLPLVLHGYVLPFIIVYAALLFVWVGVYGFLEYYEAFLIGFAIVAGLDVVTCLFCVWSVHVRCALTCRKVGWTRNPAKYTLWQSQFHVAFRCVLFPFQVLTVQDATLVKVVPTPNNGSTELVPLVKQKVRG